MKSKKSILELKKILSEIDYKKPGLFAIGGAEEGCINGEMNAGPFGCRPGLWNTGHDGCWNGDYNSGAWYCLVGFMNGEDPTT